MQQMAGQKSTRGGQQGKRRPHRLPMAPGPYELTLVAVAIAGGSDPVRRRVCVVVSIRVFSIDSGSCPEPMSEAPSVGTATLSRSERFGLVAGI